jgi:hypothetical protein
MLDLSERRENVDQDINNQIEQIISSTLNLLETLDCACRFMSQITPLNVEERNQFSQVVAYFGKLWREYFPSSRVPPKLHLLETHAVSQMNKFHVLGLLSEDPIESYYASTNRLNRTFANMNAFRRKVECQNITLNRAKHSEVAKTIKEAEIQTARKYSESTQTEKVIKIK